MGKDFDSVFRELKDDVSVFAELKLELLKLNTYERISKLIAILSYGLLLSVLVILSFMFAMITFGFQVSRWLDSSAAGFGIVAALYLFLVIAVVFNKKRICLKVINVVVSTLNTSENKNANTHVEPENSKPEQSPITV